MREASSIDLIRALCQAGAQVVAHDPVATEVAEHIFADLIRSGRLILAADPVGAAKDADLIALVTEWKAYREVDFAALKNSVKAAVILDGRNHLDPVALKKQGFHYSGIGRV